MPPKGRIKHAIQHDKRHDTGLAAPGKRVSKDKHHPPTNGHINDKGVPSVASASPSVAGTPAAAAAAAAGASAAPRPDYLSTDSDGSGAGGDKDIDDEATPSKEHAGETNGKFSHGTDTEMLSLAVTDRSGGDSICTREAASIKAMAAQATSAVSMAATILSACPMRDAIAILILLLSLPPTLLLVIHSLFISLTLVPPTTGLAWNQLFHVPNLSPSSWFHGTPGGGPSPFTMMCTDAVTIAIYLLCTLRLRNVLMDLAQAVIAISLGGAGAATGRSTRSIAVCSAIVFVSHIYRYETVHVTALRLAANILRSLDFDLSADTLWSSVNGPEVPANHGWSRLVLGCHVLAQGVLTLIRRWFAASNAKRQANKLDAEQAALRSSGKLAMLNLDTADTTSGASTDGRHPGPPPAARDKDKMSNSRKKRKQANHVRSQQPLWAAIASTKVTFMKEMEHNRISNDANESTDGIQVLDGLIPAQPVNDRVWILDITATTITFKAELYASGAEYKSMGRDDTVPQSPGIDRQKPFYVRLNGANWGSTKIDVVDGAAGDELAGSDTAANLVWSGEIYGLSSLTKYSCEFVRMYDQRVICRANLITLPAPNTEQVVTLPTTPQHQTLRPMSPTSTLKQSIAAAETKREEVRNKLKRSRKDHKSAAAAIRREIDQLQAKVSSAGGQDEKSKQRHLQIQQQIRQTNESADAIIEEMESLGEIPEDEVKYSAARRKSYDAALGAQNAAKADFDKTKCSASKELAALQAELSTVAQKRDRLNTRRTKLQEQHERLVSEQHADMTIRQHREQTRVEIREERARRVEQMVYWINTSRQQAEDYTIRANQFYQQYTAAERNVLLPQPTTPEGNLPGTNGPPGPMQQPFEFPAFASMAQQQQQQQQQQPQPQQPQQQHPQQLLLPAPMWGGGGPGGSRQRSSSMLSGYSGFTDDLDMIPQNGEYDRKGSGGSGSSGQSPSDAAPPWPYGGVNGGLAPGRPLSTEYTGPN